MSEWLQGFKLRITLEQQTLKRISKRKYQSIDEILYDLLDYLDIAYGSQLFRYKKELFHVSLFENENLGNLKEQYKEYILDNFFENCLELDLEMLEKDETYLLENGLLKDEDMSLDKDRYTLIMTNLVEIMTQSIECWYYERYKNETNTKKNFNSFKHRRNSGE